MTQPTTTQPATTPQAPARKLNLRRLERLQRLLQYGAALVLAVFVALIALAWTELRDLNKKRDEARQAWETAKGKLDAVNQELEQQQQALTAALKARTVLKEFADEKTQGNPEEARMLSMKLREAVESGIPAAAAQGGQQSQVVPRVYIHIMRAGQKARAAQLASRLEAKGFIVPPVENMEGRGIRMSVSLVKSKPGEAEAAADTAAIRAALGDFGVSPRHNENLPNTVRTRQYELWLGDDFAAPEPARPESATRPNVPENRPVLVPRDRANPDAAPDVNRNPANQRPAARPRRQSP